MTTTNTKTKQAVFDWRESVAEAKEKPEILPKLKIPANESVEVEILDKEPHEVTFFDEAGEKQSFPTITVRKIGGSARYSFPLSGTGLTSLGRIASSRRDLDLSGVKVRITATPYKHKKWGNTISYQAEEIVDETD